MANGDFIKDCAILSTFDVGSAGGTREDLLDVITNISPSETQFLSGFPKGVAKNIYHEWLLDRLEAPGDPANGNADVKCTPEASDAVFETLMPRCRVGNYTHILRHTYDVSETQRAVDNAGIADEYAYQKTKALQLLANDFEFAILHSVYGGPQVAPQYSGDCASPSGCRRMDGLLEMAQWTSQDFDCLTEDMEGTYQDVGSPSTLTLELINDMLEAMYDKGTRPRTIYTAAPLKRAISRFFLDNEIRNLEAASKLLVNAIDAIETDFGLVAIKLHRYMDDGVLLYIDESYASLPVLRPVKSTELAKVGNSDKGMVEGEMTLQMRALAGLGLQVGLTP